MVRRDMIDDAIGYRAVSVTDPWTGVSRWSEEGLKTTREFLELIGPGLYKRLRQGENLVTDFVSWAKTTIIVRFSSDPSAVYTQEDIQEAVMAHIAKVFRSGNSQAVRLPKDFALRQAKSRSRARAMP